VCHRQPCSHLLFIPISCLQGQGRAFLSCERGVLGTTEGRRCEKRAAATPLRAAWPHRAANDIYTYLDEICCETRLLETII
jgi:hypothetical protein